MSKNLPQEGYNTFSHGENAHPETEFYVAPINFKHFTGSKCDFFTFTLILIDPVTAVLSTGTEAMFRQTYKLAANHPDKNRLQYPSCGNMLSLLINNNIY